MGRQDVVMSGGGRQARVPANRPVGSAPTGGGGYQSCRKTCLHGRGGGRGSTKYYSNGNYIYMCTCICIYAHTATHDTLYMKLYTLSYIHNIC